MKLRKYLQQLRNLAPPYRMMPMDTTIDAKHGAAIYSSYRRTLKSLSIGGNRNSRAGARKQRARGLTSERYKLPISTVKAIVQRHELDRANSNTIIWSAQTV